MLYFAAFVFGLLQALSFAPTPSGFLQTLSLAGLLVLLHRTQKPIRLVLVFGATWFSAGLYWLYFSMHDVGGLPTIAAVGLVLLLAICLTSFYAISMWFWSAWRRGARSEALAFCVAFPLCWTAAEMARGYLFFSGFPWLATGYAHVDNILLKGWFAILGVYGVVLWSAFFAGVLAILILHLMRQLRFSKKAWAVITSCILALLTIGLILQGVTWGSSIGAPITVRIVQPNVPQNLKFDREVLLKNTTHFFKQASESTATLTVFPETALPFPWTELDETSLHTLQKSFTTPRAVLMGGVGVKDDAYFNSGMWLDATINMSNPPRYDKNHLLPMGETIPFGFKWLIDAMQIPLGGYQAGQGYAPFQLQTEMGFVRVSANICYENEFGEDLIRAWRDGDEKAPNIWVNMTNLGWFGTHNLSTNQAQHLYMSRARAMEMARPMLVVTNTGSSANIDAVGDVINLLPPDEATSLDVQVQPRQGMTPYIALGNSPILALISLAFGLMIIRRHRVTEF